MYRIQTINQGESQTVDLSTAHVGVVGFGKEGIACVRYVLKHGGANVRVFVDTIPDSDTPAHAVATEFTERGVRFVTPINSPELKECTIIFRSPGIPWHTPALQRAVASGSILTSQTEWFFQNTTAQIIGITGTKGKGTTTSLIYHFLNAGKVAGLPQLQSELYLTGNIGKIDPFDFIDTLTPTDWVVFELSSFQLDHARVRPHIAVVLMVTEDHLDHHSDLPAYHTAKQFLVKKQQPSDITIFNTDYKATCEIVAPSKAQKLSFSMQNQTTTAWYNESSGKIYMKHVLPDAYAEKNSAHTQLIDTMVTHTIDPQKLPLIGKHNYQNLMAALLAAGCVGVPSTVCEESLPTFIGLPHRLQVVGQTKQGLRFIDDSIATTPDTTVAAVRAMAPQPTVLLAGGSSKGSSFIEMGQYLAQLEHLTTVVVMAETGPNIAEALRAANFKGEILPADNFDHAFALAAAAAAENSCVLLSPGCASFGWFTNYVERGDRFAQLAKEYLKQK